MESIDPEEYRPAYTFKNSNSYRLIDACDYYDLDCPPDLKDLPDEEVPYYWNGIGSRGCWYNKFIPDTVYGLDISLASGPHDVAYHFGKTLKDREIADEQFLENMYKIIEKESGKWAKWTGLTFLRRRRVFKYYLAVRMFGVEAFWEGKMPQ